MKDRVNINHFHPIWTTIQIRNLIERTNIDSAKNVGQETNFNNTEESLTKTIISSGPGRYSDRSIFWQIVILMMLIQTLFRKICLNFYVQLRIRYWDRLVYQQVDIPTFQQFLEIQLKSMVRYSEKSIFEQSLFR